MDLCYRLPPTRLGSARASTALTLGSASVLDSHRPYRPDYYNEGLHTEEVSRPFWWGEGRKDRKRNGELAKSEKMALEVV